LMEYYDQEHLLRRVEASDAPANIARRVLAMLDEI
jgi:hypothetical protein